MRRLDIWNEKSVKNKIAMCIEPGESGSRAREDFGFPLPDLLVSFYQEANLREDFYSLESFRELLNQYKNQNEEFKKDAEGLIEEGWISLAFGRWRSALNSVYPWEEDGKGVDWEFADADVIRFLLWLKHQEKEKQYNIEIKDPEEIVKRWKAACHTIPDLDWLVEQHYLVCLNGTYYAGHGRYWWNEMIDQALAKLWLVWGQEKRKDWIALALSLRVSYRVGEYLEREAQRELIHFILDNYLYEYPIPSWEAENKFYGKVRMTELPAYCKEPEKYGNAELWTGNRVVDLLDYDRYGFEYYRWDDTREREYMFFIASCAVYARWCQDAQDKEFAAYLNGYDSVAALHFIRKLDTDAIYDLLTESGTFFIGFRYLLHSFADTALDLDTYVSTVGDIVDTVMGRGIKTMDFLQGEDMGNCLFWLMENYRSKRDSWEKMLETVSGVMGKEEYLDVIGEGLGGFFRKLLKIKRDVDWVSGYHLLLFCVNRWFPENSKQRQKAYYKRFMDIVWEGYRIAFDGKSNYITYLKEKYFTRQLCSELYRLYMKGESSARKRKLLLPAENLKYEKKENQIYYFYRLLLIVIYHIYEKNEEPFVKRMLFEALEQVLIGEERTEVNEKGDNNTGDHAGGNIKKRAIFDYSYMQIFSTEAVICKCVGLLKYGDEDSEYLMKHLLKEDVPELLIFYEAANDQRLKSEILQEINKKATKESLEVYDDSRALDLVMDYQIESLYPAVSHVIEKKLAAWGKHEWIQKENYYQEALHQQYRLKYCKKEYQEILEGDNLFFRAVVYMEAEEYRDYDRADRIWKKMISDRKNHRYASSVFLNYFYLLNRKLDRVIREQAKERGQFPEAQERAEERGQSSEAQEQAAMRKRQAEQEEILEKINWLIEIVEKEQIQNWPMDAKEAFGWFVVQSKKIQGGDYQRDFYVYKEKYGLSISMEEFLDETRQEADTVRQKACDTINVDHVAALSKFAALDRAHKARVYYQMRGYDGGSEKEWGAVMLTEQVLKTCCALQNYGSQLIYEDKELVIKSSKYMARDSGGYIRVWEEAMGKAVDQKEACGEAMRRAGGQAKACGKNKGTYVNRMEYLEGKVLEVKTVEKLYEDGVTMLFRELFNLACEAFYGFNVHDQEKRASTGNMFGGHKSLAEIDLSVYYGGKCGEIMEAFVLKDHTARSVFKDHMEKAIGNNIAHQPLTFMLIYGNAKNSAKAWQRYHDYICNDMVRDFGGGIIEKMAIPAVEDAFYYLNQFKDMYSGLKLLRQSITLQSGDTQEILHIYIDIARNFEGKLRKGEAYIDET